MRSRPKLSDLSLNSYFLHHVSSALLLQALMRREKPAAEQGIWRQQFCATKQALAHVRMQLPTCSGTASIPPPASIRCSLTCLLRLLIPYFEDLPNLDTSPSSSPSANRSLSVTFITPYPKEKNISAPVQKHLQLCHYLHYSPAIKCNKGRPLDYDPCGHF